MGCTIVNPIHTTTISSLRTELLIDIIIHNAIESHPLKDLTEEFSSSNLPLGVLHIGQDLPRLIFQLGCGQAFVVGIFKDLGRGDIVAFPLPVSQYIIPSIYEVNQFSCRLTFVFFCLLIVVLVVVEVCLLLTSSAIKDHRILHLDGCGYHMRIVSCKLLPCFFKPLLIVHILITIHPLHVLGKEFNPISQIRSFSGIVGFGIILIVGEVETLTPVAFGIAPTPVEDGEVMGRSMVSTDGVSGCFCHLVNHPLSGVLIIVIICSLKLLIHLLHIAQAELDILFPNLLKARENLLEYIVSFAPRVISPSFVKVLLIKPAILINLGKEIPCVNSIRKLLFNPINEFCFTHPGVVLSVLLIVSVQEVRSYIGFTGSLTELDILIKGQFTDFLIVVILLP